MLKFEDGFEFGSKAETLKRLSTQLTRARVPPFMHFSVAEWKECRSGEITEAVRHRFSGAPVIVRSSACVEDSSESANAGTFCSVGDVDSCDRDALVRAVDDVVESYETFEGRPTGTSVSDEDQIIVQRMVKDVLVSGVLFTQDMNTGAPYFVINYDDESGATDTVTSGGGYANRTLYVFRESWQKLRSERFLRIIEAVREIEAITKCMHLDIEFALAEDFTVHIFQVRRITTQTNWNRGQALRVSDTLQRLEESLQARYANASDDAELGGAVLSNMSDWNPAEMIGTTPRPLAFSLYRFLITDRVWRTARRHMGYLERRGRPLMISLAGQPYIDVRESLYSFIPAELPESISDSLVEAWLALLREQPHLHDKIEFDVAVTALSPDFEYRVDEQFPEALSGKDRQTFRETLCDLTNDLLMGRRATIDKQLRAVETLSALRDRILSHPPEPRFETVAQLFEDVIEYGTLPFSILARHAFIASAMLKGLLQRGAISQQTADRFQRSVPTVATDFIRDLDRFAEGNLSESLLIERYGHLRPGTYDILSLRYGDQFGRIMDTTRARVTWDDPEPFELDPQTRQEIDALLSAEGYEIDSRALFEYLRKAIQAREYAKFCFTRNISDALEVIAALGEHYGLSREELSYIDIRQFFDCFVKPGGRTIESELRGHAQQGAEQHAITNSIRLPSVITQLSDLWIVPLRVDQPNYITRNSVNGYVVAISGALRDPEVIDHKIVAIESADPGFDWIFTRPILGLVTRFGGANSHMAIRCAEFGLPAAIGCGEQIFERVVEHGHIDLNCAEGQIRVSRLV